MLRNSSNFFVKARKKSSPSLKLINYVNRKGKGTNKEDSSASSDEEEEQKDTEEGAKSNKKSKTSKKEDKLDYEKEGKKHYKNIEEDDFFVIDDS